MIPWRPYFLVPPCCAVALGVIAVLAPRAREAKIYPPVYTTGHSERAAVNSSSLAMILGEVRTNIADFIWVKSELYSHRGLRFKPHVDEEEAMDVEEVRIGPGETEEVDPQDEAPAAEEQEEHPEEHAEEEHEHEHEHERDSPHEEPAAGEEEHDAHHGDEDGHEHAHGGKKRRGHDGAGGGHAHEGKLWIPSQEADFRGFVGVIQREVQPYGKHTFQPGSQILPWYRIQTAVNPQQARAYVVAGWLLMKERNEPDHLKQAEDFLREGAKNNPDFFPIRVMLGRVLIAQKRYDDAITEFGLARDTALKKRPPKGKTEAHVWEDSDEEDFGFAVRYIPYIQFRILNDLDAAEKSAREGLKLMPRDQPLRNFRRLIRLARNEGQNPPPAPAVPATP